MQEHAQSVFQIEKMQPTWLTDQQRQQYKRTAWSILAPYNALFYGVPFVFAAPFIGVSSGLIGSLLAVAGLVLGWVYGTGKWKQTRGQLLAGLSFGIAFGVSFGAAFNILAGIVVGLVVLTAYVSVIKVSSLVLSGQSSDQDHIVIVEVLRFSRQRVSPWQGLGGIVVGTVSAGGIYFFHRVFIGTEVSPINLVFGIIGGGIALMLSLLLQSGLTSGEVEMRTQPNQGIKSTATNANRAALGGMLTYILLALLGFVPVSSLQYGLALGISQAIFTASSYWLLYGGGTVVWHYALRDVLYRAGAIPRNYARFLDYASALIFLRKVGGGYIFVHRYLLEYFAGLENAS